jgi:tyrosyl-tRNA synthetase
MQGYDSVAVKADIELGGFDQLFNLKAGRVIQEYFGQPKQNIMTFQMLEGTDGRKMSSSWGNIISIVDDPDTMFGKVMAIKDELLVKYFTLCTDLPLEEVKKIEKELEKGSNPKDSKMRLAQELVTMYHTEKDATLAKNSWISAFQNKGVPDSIPELVLQEGKELGEMFVQEGVVVSKTDWRRLITDGAVRDMDKDVEITDPKQLAYEGVFKVGKKRFIKIVIKH